MATILTAGNATNGLSLTPDNTGILELKTGTGAGTTAMSISTAQAVTLAAGISGTTGSFSGNMSFNSGYGSAAVAYGCRAWVNFNGTGTVAIRASGNVSSITDNGAGDYTVNFTNAMPDVNYSATTSSMSSNLSPRLSAGLVVNSSSFRMNALNGSINALEDQSSIFVNVFR